MQEIKREVLVNKASELLKNGTVDRVFGWKKGEFDYDITPALFTTAEDIEKEFVWGDFCGANFSKYLVKETGKSENKVLVFLKPCDTYSFNQLLTEHRFDREKVYAVGVPCNGMLDTGKIKSNAEGIAKVTDNGDKVVIETLFDGEITLERNELLPDRCLNCKSKKHVAYDELLGEDGTVLDSHRFAPPAPAKSACLITPIRALKTRRLQTSLRKKCSTLSVLSTLWADVPIAASAQGYVPSTFRCTCSTASS